MKIPEPALRIFALADKEWIQVRRDTRSLILSLVAPVLLVLLFGYALNMDVKHVRLAVMDMDRTSFTRQLVERFSHTEYLDVYYAERGYDEIYKLINKGSASMAIVIPAGFTSDFRKGHATGVQLLVDGSDSLSSTVATGYVRIILSQFNVDMATGILARSGLSRPEQPVDLRSRIWYNEELKSRNLIIPGIIVIILAIISALITSLAISREWERGTMESLLSTPVRPFEVMTGKLIPYLVIGAFDVTLTFAIGYFVFGINMRGSFLELLALSMLFLVGTSTLGLVISSATRVQVLSIQVAMLVTYLPSFILSGFIFPIKNMPVIIQGITYLVPAKYMIYLIKGIVLKGVAASLMYMQILFMLIFAGAIVVISIRKFRLTVE